VTDSAMVMRGRKGLMKASGMTGAARSPLTQQLVNTLNNGDSYVSIPLTGGRTKATTIYNLRDKAKRANVELHYTASGDGKQLFAWFTKPAAAQKSQSQGSQRGIVKSKPNGHGKTISPQDSLSI